MQPLQSIHPFAHAKLNLAIAVGPAVPDGPRKGWHPIASWMVPIDLGDSLTLTRLEADRLSRYAILWDDAAPRPSAIDWSITKDLAVRAHLLLERELGRPLPVQFKCVKRTPVGGGLGGGSSDAASALMGLNELFGLGLSVPRLGVLSRELGSDVAYFLREPGAAAPDPAIVEGFGDRIERTPAVSGHALLLFPDFGCPTPAVYAAFDQTHATDEPFEHRAARVRAMADAATLEGLLFNDLAGPAEAVAPALAELRAAVHDATGLQAHVTGSGSTLFSIARDAEHAAWLAARIRGVIEPARLVALPVRIGAAASHPASA